MFNRYVPNRKLVGEKNEMTISYNGCKDLSYRVQKKKKKKKKKKKNKKKNKKKKQKKKKRTVQKKKFWRIFFLSKILFI